MRQQQQRQSITWKFDWLRKSWEQKYEMNTVS